MVEEKIKNNIKLKEETIITEEYLRQVDKEIEFIPLTFDIVFKGVFERNLDILKKFLISTLNLELDIESTKIEILNNELLKENAKEYQKRVDIIVILNDTIFVDIEINRSSFNKVKERNTLYFNKLYSMLLETGKEDTNLNIISLYQLNLNTADKSITYGEDIIVWYSLVTKEIYIKNKYMVLKYLEFYRNIYYTNLEEMKDSEIWLSSLTATNFVELYKMLSHILTNEERSKIIKEAIRMSRLNFNLHEWEKEKIAALDRMEAKRVDMEAGIEQGIKQGIEQGLEQKTVETIKNMIKKNMDLQDISDITSKSIEEIKQIIEENK